MPELATGPNEAIQVPDTALTGRPTWTFHRWAPLLVVRRNPHMYSGAPTADQIRQGPMGDCVKLAVAGSVVELSPKTMERRLYQVGSKVVFSPLNAEGNAKILHLMDSSVPWYRTPTRRNPVPLSAHSVGGTWWVSMYEKGLALASSHSIRPTRNLSRWGPRSKVRARPGYDSLNYATPERSAAEIMGQLTGRPATIVSANRVRSQSTRAFAEHFRVAAAKRKPLVVVFYGIPQEYGPPMGRFGAVDYHAYWFKSFDETTLTVSLRNPWRRKHLNLPLAALQLFEPTLIVGELPSDS